MDFATSLMHILDASFFHIHSQLDGTCQNKHLYQQHDPNARKRYPRVLAIDLSLLLWRISVLTFVDLMQVYLKLGFFTR